jgi:hypothetical protein
MVMGCPQLSTVLCASVLLLQQSSLAYASDADQTRAALVKSLRAGGVKVQR